MTCLFLDIEQEKKGSKEESAIAKRLRDFYTVIEENEKYIERFKTTQRNIVLRMHDRHLAPDVDVNTDAWLSTLLKYLTRGLDGSSMVGIAIAGKSLKRQLLYSVKRLRDYDFKEFSELINVFLYSKISKRNDKLEFKVTSIAIE